MNDWTRMLNEVSASWSGAMWLFIWQSAVLAGIVWLLTLATRNAPAALRFWLWMLVPLRLVVMPLLTVSLPLLSVPVQELPTRIEPSAAMTDVAPVPESHAVTGVGEPAFPDPIVSENDPLSRTLAAEPAPSPTRLTHSAWLLTAWLAGVVLFTLRLFGGWLRVYRFVSRAAPLTDGDLLDSARRIAKRVGLSRVPRIRVTSEDICPLVVGMIHPTVLLPAVLLEQASPSEMAVVLSHEFAHIRRYDPLIGWLLAICETPYFFHPVFHWAKRQSMRERELACDEMVLAQGQAEPAQYAHALITAAAGCRALRSRIAPAAVVAESFGDLKRRIARICSSVTPKAHLSKTSVVFLAFLAVIGLPGIILTTRSMAKSATDGQVTSKPADDVGATAVATQPSGTLERRPPTDSSVAPGYDGETRRVLEAALAEYGKLKSYEDIHIAMYDIDADEEVRQSRQLNERYALAFRAPNRIALEGRFGSLHCDGNKVWLYLKDRGQYIEYEDADKVELAPDSVSPRDALNAPWFYVERHPVLYTILHAGKGDPKLLWLVKRWVGARRDLQAGRALIRVDAVVPVFTWSEQERKEWERPLLIWFSENSHLIEETRFDQTEEMRKDWSAAAIKDIKPPPRIGHAYNRYLFEKIRVNQDIPDERFVFKPGPDDQKVTSFKRDDEWQQELIGRKAPALNAVDTSGATIKLADYRGRIVVLDFWASWCGPCVAALPELQKISQRVGAAQLSVIGVTQDAPGAERKVEELLKSKGITFRQIADPDKKLSGPFRVSGIPATYVIDKEGVVRAVHVGFDENTAKELAEQIQSLLAGKALIPPPEPPLFLHRSARQDPPPPSRDQRAAMLAKLRPIYALKEGEFVRCVRPPYPQPRQDFLHALFPTSAMPSEQFLFIVHDGEFKCYGASGAQNLRYVVARLMKIAAEEIDGYSELLKTEVEADFIFRQPEPSEAMRAALESVFRNDLKLPVRLAWHENPRDVFVIRGKYKLMSDSTSGPKRIEIYDRALGDWRTGGGGTADFEEFLHHVSDQLKCRFVSEVKEPPLEVEWHDNPPLAAYRELDVSMAIEHLHEQTGLTFTKERRGVKTLEVSRDDASTSSATTRSESEGPAALPASKNPAGEPLPKIVIPAKLSLKGQVTDEQKNPIAGAWVKLTNKDVLSEPMRVRHGFASWISENASGDTDKNGWFEFTGLNRANTDVIVLLNGHRTAILHDVPTGSDELKITLFKPVRYQLSGQVTGANGRPIPEAEVILAERSYRGPPRPKPKMIRLQTTSDGKFDFAQEFEPLNALGYLTRTLIVQKPGYGIWGRTVDSTGGETSVNIALSPAAEISGRVLDINGKPIENAELWTYSFRSRQGGSEIDLHYMDMEQRAPRIHTDAKGRFSLHGLPAGCAAALTVSAPGFALQRSFDVVIGTRDLEIKLEREAILKGQVVRGEDDAPIAGLLIGTQGKTSANWIEAKTDAQGRFELRGLKGEQMNVLPVFDSIGGKKVPEWTAAAIEITKLDPGQTRDDLKMVITKGGLIRGKVTDSKEHPLRGIDIAFYSAARPRSGAACQSTLTTPDGSWAYRFPPGEVYVYIRTNFPDTDWTSSGYTLQLRDGQTIENIDFRLHSSVSAESPYR